MGIPNLSHKDWKDYSEKVDSFGQFGDDEQLEKMIDKAGREKVFAMATANGWNEYKAPCLVSCAITRGVGPIVFPILSQTITTYKYRIVFLLEKIANRFILIYEMAAPLRINYPSMCPH